MKKNLKKALAVLLAAVLVSALPLAAKKETIPAMIIKRKQK